MISYTTTILKFSSQGEKTGWTYIDVPAEVAQQLKPDHKKSFQVKGLLDAFAFEKVNLLPMGKGHFIMALNSALRKGIRKSAGATLHVQLEADSSKFEYPEDIMTCLHDEPEASAFFDNLPASHQKYYIKWIDNAKTDVTRTRRIARLVNACLKSHNRKEMMRHLKADEFL